MRGVSVLRLASFLPALIASACTVYTQCPEGTPAPGTGGSGTASGATGGGGSSGMGMGAGTGGTITGGAAPMGEWLNETFNLEGMESECGNVAFFATKPGDDLVIAGIARQGLFAKSSDSDEWYPLGTGEDSDVITNRPSSLLFDPDDPDVFWESGIYNGGGVYRTDDGGETFVDLGTMHNDHVSVDFDDPDRQTLLASGHETPHKLQKSSNGGGRWNEIGDNLPEAAQVCPFPLIRDADTFLLGCNTYAGGERGIWRSTDGGDSWEKVSDHGGGAAPLIASDGTIYWTTENNGGLVKSTDDGESWSEPLGSGVVAGLAVVELPDGRLAALSQRQIIVSEDGGQRWSFATPEAPFQPSNFTYSPERGAFYTWHWTCGTGDVPVPDDAIMAFEYSVEAD
jgi:photosystem II stability/assembly factor-like uncharacterized protein